MISNLIDWWWAVRHPRERRQRLWAFVAATLTTRQTLWICLSLSRARNVRVDTSAYIAAELRRFNRKYRVLGNTFYWPLDEGGREARLAACRERGAR